ncbi:MAG: 50S ribosomal protein L2 [Sphingomonadales bacterium]|nr:50S ribosomal protein L2 [Sphingomonadales bacterium]
MAVKRLNPTTPGQRFHIANSFAEITTDKPEKSLIIPIKKSGGRNNQGRMTMRFIGGGHKRRYRMIDFKRANHGVAGEVLSVEYDPNRSAFISLIQYKDGEKRYIIAPNGIKVGQKIEQGPGVPPEIGNALPMSEIPLGSLIHNIEMAPGQGAKICRSAGSYAQLLGREDKYATIKLPSGELRKVLSACLATIGSVSNSEHNLLRKGKAGRSRWMGIRPRTRSTAMNPVDHPMGGGEGRNKGGQARSRNLIYSQGQKTRAPKKATSRLIIERRKSKRNSN